MVGDLLFLCTRQEKLQDKDKEMDKNREKLYDHTFNFYNYKDGWTQVHSI